MVFKLSDWIEPVKSQFWIPVKEDFEDRFHRVLTERAAKAARLKRAQLQEENIWLKERLQELANQYVLYRHSHQDVALDNKDLRRRVQALTELIVSFQEMPTLKSSLKSNDSKRKLAHARFNNNHLIRGKSNRGTQR